MTSQITITKDGLKLPRKVLRAWRGAKASMRTYPGVIVVQQTPKVDLSFDDALKKIRKAVKKVGITPADVQKAIRWARRPENKIR